MVFEDSNDIVYQTFMAEYRCSSWYSKGFGWRVFLENKDIGIEIQTDFYIRTAMYKIVDEKKWLITKLKYGI